MPIERDDSVERQTQVDRMINEFREAQSRRFGKPNDKVVEAPPRREHESTAHPFRHLTGGVRIFLGNRA